MMMTSCKVLKALILSHILPNKLLLYLYRILHNHSVGDHKKLRTTIVFSYDLAIIDCNELKTKAYEVLIPVQLTTTKLHKLYIYPTVVDPCKVA